MIPVLTTSYPSPAVAAGQVVYDRFFRCRCRVVGWRDAPIRWPEVVRVHKGGTPSLWMNPVLERAVRNEPQAALKHWFGVSVTLGARWRKWLGTGWQEKMTRRAVELGVRPLRVWQPRGWTPDQLALLGTDTDEVIAERIGRRAASVASMRSKLRIPSFDRVERRGRPKKKPPQNVREGSSPKAKTEGLRERSE